MEDKRQFTRIRFDASAHLHAAEQSWESHVIDISLHGVLISVPAGCSLPTNRKVTLDLVLSDQTTQIQMQGEVRYSRGDHIGIECQQLDVDSASHLRRLVELNMGDSNALERELDALWKLHYHT